MATMCLDPIVLFDNSFPATSQREMVRVLRVLYQQSRTVSGGIVTGPHEHDLHPHVKRALIERELEYLGGKFPKMTAKIETNRSGNSHVVIEADHFILTESFVRTPRTWVRRAAYRDTDSACNYPLLSENDGLDQLQPETKFSAILLHGYGSRESIELGFAVIRFPRPNARGYLDEIINLLERHPATTAVVEPNAEEEILDLIDPKININQPKRLDS